jgi:hypothetical protein
MNKKEEILCFLQKHLFDPVLCSPFTSHELKCDFKSMFKMLQNFSAEGILLFFWTTMANEEVKMIFSHRLHEEGITNYDAILCTFKNRFTYDWLYSDAPGNTLKS